MATTISKFLTVTIMSLVAGAAQAGGSPAATCDHATSAAVLTSHSVHAHLRVIRLEPVVIVARRSQAPAGGLAQADTVRRYVEMHRDLP